MENGLEANGTAGSFAGCFLKNRAATTSNCPGGAQPSSSVLWSPGTAPYALGEPWHRSLFPRGPQHSSLCPWVSTGKVPCVLGESWHSFLCCGGTWHNSLPWGSIGTASSVLKEP